MATSGLPLWSTTAASNASADPAVNWAEGMAPSAVNDSARAMMASAAKWRDDLYGITSGLTTGGTTTAFTVTTNSTYATAAVMSGAIFTIVMNATSGAAPTLAVDGLTARALNVSTGVAVPTGALISGTPYMVRYVHATTEFIVLNPSIRPNAALDIIGGTQLTAPANGDTLPIYDLSATANRRILVSDFLKVVNDLTADATPDSAADYVLTYDASASAAKKVLLANLPAALPPGFRYGCTLSNGTDAVNDINIAPGKWRDSTDTADITIATALGKQLDANWALGGTTGSPAGMRNTAAGITDGTYHLYAGRTAASSAGDLYAYAGVAGTDPDSSASIATMLAAWQAETGGSSYVYARRVGSIIRSGATILAFIQIDDNFRFKSPVLSINGVSQTTSSALRALTVPLGPKVLAKANIATASGSGDALYISAPAVNDENPSLTAAPLGMLGISVSINSGSVTAAGMRNGYEEFTDASGQWRFDSISAVTLYVATIGWRDLFGKAS